MENFGVPMVYATNVNNVFSKKHNSLSTSVTFPKMLIGKVKMSVERESPEKLR